MRVLIKMCGAVLVVAVTALADSGYLATVGPPPLRFESPAKTGGARVALPPLPLPETNELVAVVEPPAPPPLEIPPPSTNPPPILINIFGGSDPATNSWPLAAREADVVSPQLWLKYFTKNTNAGASGGIIAPLGFQPPQPTVPPSSKSTFQTGP